MNIVNDYILKHRNFSHYFNIDQDVIKFEKDERGYITIVKEFEIQYCNGKQTKVCRTVTHNRKDPIDLTNLKLDKFDRKYAELQQPFSYQIMKPILDKLKETFPDCKVYCDLKRVYTTKETSINSVNLIIFHNVKKNTINVMLRA